MEQVKRVLITGANGFIGTHLCEYLYQNGISVVAASHRQLDVCVKDAWENYRGQEIGHVVHLAGRTFVPASWEQPEMFFNASFGGTLNALEFCRTEGAGMTYLSAYVYGAPEGIPISEDSTAHPNNPYACAKYAGEELCRYYCELFSMHVTALRPFNVYGPGQATHFLIPLIIQQAKGNEKEIVLQDLTPKRDYVYVGDVCRAIECSVKNTTGFHVFNVGYGKSYSVEEVVSIIQKLLNTNKRVLSKHTIRKNEMNDVVADISKIRDAWGWDPKFDLVSGLKQYVGELAGDRISSGLL